MTKSAPAKRPAKNKVTKSRTVAGFMFLFSFHSHLYRTMRYIVIRGINDISLIVKGAKGSQPHIIKTNELQILVSHRRFAFTLNTLRFLTCLADALHHGH